MSTNVNPIQLIQMIQQGANPEQLTLFMLEQQALSGNPLLSNLVSLAKEGKSKDIEQIARNIVNEKGLDFDTEFNKFKKQFGIK